MTGSMLQAAFSNAMEIGSDLTGRGEGTAGQSSKGTDNDFQMKFPISEGFHTL